jgi:CheY-like chemotaxis protein
MRKSILLIEDDELDVISVKRTLSKLAFPHELFIAYNGREAVNFLDALTEDNLPDVILLDLNMPKMNGIEFLQNIRSTIKYKDLKIFVMTTSNETSDRIRTSEFGISGYIIKPMNYTDNVKNSDSMEAFVQFHLTKIFSEA